MKRYEVLDLINKGIINLDNNELENFIKLSNEEIRILSSINDKNTLIFLKQFYFSDVDKDKKLRVLRMIDKMINQELVTYVVDLLTEFINADRLWNSLEKNIELVDSKEKINAIMEVKNYLYHSHIFDKVLENILFTNDIDVVNLYISILTNEKLRNSNNYQYVIDMALSISDNNILQMFSLIACNSSFLDFSNYAYVLDLISEINSQYALSILISILDKDTLYDDTFERVVNIIKNADERILISFKELALNDDLLYSSNYEFALETLCKISNYNLSNLFVKIATNKNLLFNDDYRDVLELVSKIKNANVMYSVICLIQYNDMLESGNFVYVLTEMVENQERYYSQAFINILTDYNLLYSEMYFSYVDLLFNIFDESIILTLSDFITWDNFDVDVDGMYDFFYNALQIEDVNLLKEYLNIVCYDDICNSNDFEIIFNKALSIKKVSIMKLYIDLVLYMIKNEERFQFDYVLDNAVEIEDENRFEFFILIIKDNDLSNTDYLNSVLDSFSMISLECLPYFLDIVLDREVLPLDSYEDILTSLSKVKDALRMKLISDTLNTNLGVKFISSSVNIKDNRILKDFNILFNDFDSLVMEDSGFSSKFSSIIDAYLGFKKNECNNLTSLIRSKDPVVLKYKGILYKYFDLEKCDLQLDVLSNVIPKGDLEVIKEEIYNDSLMYKRVRFNDVLQDGTKEEIINSLMEIGENEEVTENVLVKKLI